MRHTKTVRSKEEKKMDTNELLILSRSNNILPIKRTTHSRDSIIKKFPRFFFHKHSARIGGMSSQEYLESIDRCRFSSRNPQREFSITSTNAFGDIIRVIGEGREWMINNSQYSSWWYLEHWMLRELPQLAIGESSTRKSWSLSKSSRWKLRYPARGRSNWKYIYQRGKNQNVFLTTLNKFTTPWKALKNKNSFLCRSINSP